MPTVERQSAKSMGGRVMFTPSASITSAEPHLEVMLRLPCLATRIPAPAATSAVAVEILNVPLASPPVPHVSTTNSLHSVSPSWPFEFWPKGIDGATARMASAKPTISSTVSPFI